MPGSPVIPDCRSPEPAFLVLEAVAPFTPPFISFHCLRHSFTSARVLVAQVKFMGVDARRPTSSTCVPRIAVP
jgi:hypothetical protein